MAHNGGTNGNLPVPNPTNSYWRSQPHHLDSHRSTPELPKTCDIVVIGAGLAGVSTVYHLSNTPNPPQILLLEARQTCSGATGRNGGHAKTKTDTFLKTTARLGPGASDALARFSAANVAALKAVVERERIACEFELRRSYDVYASNAEAHKAGAGLQRALARGDEWARDRDWIGPELAERVTSVRGARGAVSSPCCSLWPYKFVTGLLARAMEMNARLNVQTETPVLGLVGEEEVREASSTAATTMTLKTERGEVRANRIVFATNAYTAALLPEYGHVITPYKGTAAHLAPSGGREPVFPHLGSTYNLEFGLDPVLETVDYLNPRPDGGIVVGGGKWLYERQRELWYDTVDDSTLIEPVMEARYFDGYMQGHFRGWEDSGAETQQVWTGIMGLTPDGLPHVGKVPRKQNQWILAGFNGGGNALAFVSAQGVAKMVLEDVALGDTGVEIPELFDTTEQRLGIHPRSQLAITLDVDH